MEILSFKKQCFPTQLMTLIYAQTETQQQCEGEVFENKFFFANANEECPAGCNKLKPISSEGAIGTCNLATIITSDVPACNVGCKGSEKSKKLHELTNDCCKITLETQCKPESD